MNDQYNDQITKGVFLWIYRASDNSITRYSNVDIIKEYYFNTSKFIAYFRLGKTTKRYVVNNEPYKACNTKNEGQYNCWSETLDDQRAIDCIRESIVGRLHKRIDDNTRKIRHYENRIKEVDQLSIDFIKEE